MRSYLKRYYLLLLIVLYGCLMHLQAQTQAPLQASFTMDRSGGCSPAVINFTSTSTGVSANTTYRWDFGNGNSSSLPNGASVYIDEKAYTVTLTVTDGAKQSTATQQVTVYSPPTLGFNASPIKNCAGLPTSFTANVTAGSGTITSYTWDFGDGSTVSGSAAQPHTYTTEQQATVSLTVVNNYGCHTTLTKPNIVTIAAPLKAGFTADKRVLCQLSDPVTFSNNSTGPGILDYLWDFGDGATSTAANPSHTFSQKGDYPIRLTVHSSEGCTVTLNQGTPIVAANYTTDINLPATFCQNSYLTFVNQAHPQPDNVVWQVDNVPQYYSPGSLSYAFAATGTHTIVLNNTFGTCQQSKTVTIDVKPQLQPAGIDISPANNCGAPVPVSFTNATPGAVRWDWDFNYNGYSPNFSGSGQSTSHTYTNNQQYQIFLRATSADGCVATISQYFNISQLFAYINAGPGVLSNCGQLLTVPFSMSSAEPVTAASWDFGDGTTSTSLTPSHTFKNTGSYLVKVTYTTQGGCTNTGTYWQYSQPPPSTVLITTNPGNPVSCLLPITVQFATQGSDPAVSFTWDFGDKSPTSTAASPTHTYPNQGRFAAILTYVTQAGCTGTAISPVVVVDPKITAMDFSINPNPVCGPNPVSFTTTPNLYNINSYNWDFGDGQFDYSSINPAHAYTAPGTYTVKLYARNIGGCDTSISRILTVNPPFPKISSHSNTCDGTRGEVSFQQTSVQATTLIWNFGDGTTATTPGNQLEMKHTYAKTGAYNVSLTATNGGCNVTYYYPNKVYVLLKQKPTLTGNLSSICNDQPVNIVVANLEKNPLQSDIPYYAYYYAGYYFTGTQYADGSDFIGNRTDAGWDYRWTTTYNATLSNFQAGKKDIRLILTSYGFGCVDTTSFMPLAIKNAIGGFEITSDKRCYQSPVTLHDTSKTNGPNTILQWSWDFGDGQSQVKTTGGTITHQYVNPGVYTVGLKITDAAGCSSNVPYTQQVQVRGPKAAFYASGTDVHLNTQVYFTNTTNDYGNTGTTYYWDFGDGFTGTDQYPSHTYTVPGTYTVTMRAVNPAISCGSDAAPVTIIVRNFNSNFSMSKYYITGSCPPLMVSFANTSYNYIKVSWDFGDGVTAGNVNYASHVYEKPGRYIVTLHVDTYNNLSADYIDSVIFLEPSAILPPPPSESCIGSIISLPATVTDAASYSWDFGDGTINADPQHKYTTAGSFTATLLMKSTDGCLKDTTLRDLIKIRPDPQASVTPAAPLICLGSSIQLHAAGTYTYEWIPATGLSDATIANPTASPGITTNYELRVKDDIGCQNKTPVTLTVIQPGHLQTGPDTAVCAGTPVKLHATGEELYQWINNTTGLSATDIPNPTALTPETITYTVKGSDSHNCFTDQKDITVTVHPLPVVTAGPDKTIEAGYDATIYGSGSDDIVKWQWMPEKYLSCYDCATPLCTPLASTIYTLQAKTRFGCAVTDTMAVNVDCQEAHVHIPNAFTPDGNGVNDVFMIKGISIVRHMVIFGRWGEKVFERDNFIAGDRSSCWNGTYHGQLCAPGTYVYYVELECPSGGTFMRKGSFVLIR